ncbi:hypothetical protein G195_006865 [Phytophthora kernoviae 00238/432]|uniref:Uncharacterized protein n=1 Tax=Phytophthora kernoviae 00238/432 TaxID=1284355 RepID=A0A8J4S366_9STRA|nr:hypothetical protein G195_006865 [Phytophthora kernoviae 00238/432]
MHAKSKVERNIKFSTNREDVPNGQARRGWKLLADHVNRMDYAMKRRFMLDGLGPEDRAALKKLLITHNEEWWNASPDELKEALA